MSRLIIGLILVGSVLVGCASTPDNIAMPPADKREPEAKVVIPPLNSPGQK